MVAVVETDADDLPGALDRQHGANLLRRGEQRVDDAAKATVAQLISDAGFEPVDAGGSDATPLLEAFAKLVIGIAYRQGRGPFVYRFQSRWSTPGRSRLGSVSLPVPLVAELREALGAGHVITEPEQLRVYECDGLTGHRAVPELVALPGSTEEVQAVVRACHRERVPFVARGAGTGLSGGATPVAGGVVVSLARMNRILEIDLASQRVVVEPGVANLDVSHAVAGEGFFYAPDPSSQQVCTIGGNVAENSGGAHCLKHGFTAHHVTGLTLVLPDGEVVELGGKALDPDGPDLLGVVVGSEGTLGIVTRITLRIVRSPQVVRTLLAGFETMDAAGAAVSGIVAAGILPSAIEMMDRLTIEAAELSVSPGYPEGAGAVLLVELDGVAEQVEDDVADVERICRECGAFGLRTAANEADRALLWKGRKSAFAAMGRIATDYYVQDGVVPRTRLPDVLRRIEELSAAHGLRVGNVFHAGDGNLHPLVLYDAEAGETERARELAEAILDACLDAGGSLTGEHGVGMDKACSMPRMFSERDLHTFERLRRAFDPAGLCNPGKVIPTPRLCGEVPGPYRVHALERMGVAERF
ncbi:MAG TPA: FAD-linked oxidase C-terminal domain-containing protein [Gaiellaceae bacterium]|nr:FAD-linked oxidase C-terminal domain-containing protein [Gaiellaceae bacterium]